MKERPILFSGPMVKAILEGRKTQTRRVLKQKEVTAAGMRGIMGGTGPAFGPCPYGEIGDRIWVRETLQYGARNNPEPRHNHLWRYAADNSLVMVAEEKHTEMLVWATHKEGDVCVSIHMPRWASRLTLEITNTRVERVQDISEDDVRAEGIQVVGYGDYPADFSGKHLFQELWDSINGARDGGFGWDKNPWCWVIEFRKL